jgi:hypothetical protein
MCKLRWMFIAVVCLGCTALWAQGAPQVFVSTGAAGKIYSIDTVTKAVTLLVSTPGADYEGMVVAPHNAPADLPGNDPAGTTHYLVYVCDTANNSIVRFDPSNPASLDPIYNGGALQHPQCGRITTTGDLVVSSTVAGSGLWKFSGVTNLPLGSGAQVPTALVAVSGSGQGLAQKNIGDILVVDNTNNRVLRSPAGQFQTTSTFISSGLSQPFGIARGSAGDLFVSNNGVPAVVHFNAQGGNPVTCQTFSDFDIPKLMQVSLDNTVYVAVSGGHGGSVRAVNGSTCSLNQTYVLPYPAVGVALPPTMTASQNVSVTNGVSLNNFGFTAYEMNGIVGPCSGSISVGLGSPAAIDTLIALSGSPADPAVNLGLDGFEVVFSTAKMNGCLTSNGSTNNFQMSDFLSVSVTTPGIVVCDDLNQSCLPTNVNLAQTGAWPIGGYLPQDFTSGGTKSLRCNIFMVNAHPQSTAQGPDTFCGYEPPVNNTFDTTLATWNPALAAQFSDGGPVPIKFKLGMGSGGRACHGGNYVKNATALLSIAQIADSQGSPVFVPIGLTANGSSGIVSAFFKPDNNQQFLFNWNSGNCVMPSGATQLCPKGTYSITVEFPNDLTLQTIYDQLTTLVVLK